MTDQPKPDDALGVAARDVLAFLNGAGPLKNRWFGDSPPPGERGNFWWRKHLDSLDALTDALAVANARVVWRPIKTAPRDGSWFLACATQPGWRATRIVRFLHPEDRLPIHGEGEMWPSAPTHWMPLPASPEPTK